VSNLRKSHWFPAEIISRCAWLCFRFCLSYRHVEELMAVCGVLLTYEAVRYWCRRFRQAYANALRRQRSQLDDKRHLNEVFSTIHGERHSLWRAVDQDGWVLEILVQRPREKGAAEKFFRKLLKGCRYGRRVIVTDQLKGYGAADREMLPDVEPWWHRYLKHRAENSQRPTHQRERRMRLNSEFDPVQYCLGPLPGV
jgi:putative transposase